MAAHVLRRFITDDGRRRPSLHAQIIGKWLTIRPNSTICEMFFFPDGNGALESINDPARGVVCCGAMRGGDDDENTGFANFESAETMGNGGVANLELPKRLSDHRFHLLYRHFFIGFIFQK